MRNGSKINVSGRTVGACQPLIVDADLLYNSIGLDGAVGAGFTAGTAHIILPNGTAVEVTPGDMGTTAVGSIPPAANACPGAVNPKAMNSLTYALTLADLSASSAVFTFEYTNGLSLLPNALGVCNLRVGISLQESVSIAPVPTATVTPATNSVCAGSSASLTVTATGFGPFTYSWSGPNSFFSTDKTIAITNAQPSNAGIYAATATDGFGCSAMCFGTLIYCSPQFTNLTILGSDLILSGSGGTSDGTYTVLAASDLTAATSNWVAIRTNNFGPNGQFNFTNSIDFNERARFFRLRIP